MQTITVHTPSEEFVVAQNGTAESKPQQASSPFNKLLEANTPLLVWLIYLGFGGGILALYYARIGYLPDMEWKAALVYLFIGSVVGGVVGLLLTMSLYLPGIIWSETIVYDRCLKFSYTPPANEQQSNTITDPEICIRSIFRYLGLPFLVVLSFSHVALLFGRITYWVIAGVLLVLTFVSMRMLFGYRLQRANSSSSTSVSKVVSRHTFKLSAAFTLSVLLNQISMYVI